MACVTGDISGLMANMNVWVLFVISHGMTVRIELYFTSEECWAQFDELIKHRNIINYVGLDTRIGCPKLA